MGLDIYLKYGKNEIVQEDSKKYPNHFFKIGYFRSSYNEWGLNHVLSRTIGKNLYYIFEPPDRKYTFKPNWLDCRMRCLNVLEEFNDFTINKLGNVAITKINVPPSTESEIPRSEKDATDIFLKMRDGKDVDSTFRSFANRNGHFYFDGLKCYAFIPGKNSFGRDCVYIVFNPELEENEKNEVNPNVYKDYSRCLEIVLETIDYVLDHPKKEIKKFNLCWSG